MNFFSWCRFFTPFLALGLAACGSDSNPGEAGDPVELPWPCEFAETDPVPEFAQLLGCRADFQSLASEPLDASIPGARSVKVVLDRQDGDKLYFQNSTLYKVHYDFVSEHLSRPGMIVPLLSAFNEREYFKPDRRFILGAVTHYEQPNIWALELAPYDTADAAMIEQLYGAVQQAAFFGPPLAFLPSSDAIERVAKQLPKSVRIRTTQDVFAGTTYQPLNLGSTIGYLRFLKASELDTVYVGARDVVVLDEVPNDISVVSGLITEEFQTPLSHVNVLAQNRGTPNMGLRDATKNPQLRALENQWVELTVRSNEWKIRAATEAEADAHWEANKPDPVLLPDLDLTVTDLRDIRDVTDESDLPLSDAVKRSLLAFGAKAANYSVLVNTPGVPIRPGFAIPVYYYVQFMEQNGFFDHIDELLADEKFQNDPQERDLRLRELREAMEAAPVDQEFQDLLREKLERDFPGQTMRFRSSTNAEDLEGFPCAGCYESRTGDPADWDGDFLQAIRDVWASIWLFRTFEERAHHSMDHKGVGMAMLVHHNFPYEEANGVALTANPFDPDGIDPAFYVNVQWGGGIQVVNPPSGIYSDEFLYYFESPNQPTTYLSRSSLLGPDEYVLNRSQIQELGKALKAIHERYSVAYGPAAGNRGWYAMDVEFKYDDEDWPGEAPKLLVKQARPHPGRGK